MTTPDPDLSRSRALRFALLAGFGGMAVIFLLAAVDSIRLLSQMRQENRILREASMDRSRRLASVRTYVLLTHQYVADSAPDQDSGQMLQHMPDLKNCWSRAIDSLAGYQPSNTEERRQVGDLHNLLEQHWTTMERVAGGSRNSPPTDGIRDRTLRTAILEISTRVENADASQLSRTEADIQNHFEFLGRRLSRVLLLALLAAISLGVGCAAYILRIEQQNDRRYGQIVEARHSLEQLSARLVDAQETERRNISRELHDEVGQTLGAVLVDAANLALRLPPDDAISRRYLDNIRAQADSSVNSIRNIALLLRPSMLDDLGLVPALEWQAREVSRRNGIQVKVNAHNVSDALPDAVRTCVYRVVQEALHNVTRHSDAKNVQVDVTQTGDCLKLTVKDDGKGFNVQTTRGMGLLGMEERVKQLGGNLKIHSTPGQGTTIETSLPLAPGDTA